MEVENLTVADIAYPLVTKRVVSVFQQQLVHVHNGCISDDLEHHLYVKVGTINYHSTGHHLDHYQSLRGTSKVEAVHSVLDRTFYAQRGIGTEVFDGGFLGTITNVSVLSEKRFCQTACHPRYVAYHTFFVNLCCTLHSASIQCRCVNTTLHEDCASTFPTGQ